MPRGAFAIVGGALGLALLAGCQNLDEQISEITGGGGDGPQTAAFECDEGREFAVRLSGDRDEALVDTGDETYELARADGDGDRRVYSNEDEVRLEISNEDAYLRIPGESDFQDCQRVA